MDLARWRREGYTVGRKRMRRLMARMGLEPIYQRPRTTIPHPGHRIYPYLLRDMVIERPNQVWCADITYIPMRRGFHYLIAIMDWSTRKVLSWRVSNTMDVEFCIEALEEAMARFGSHVTQEGPDVLSRYCPVQASGSGGTANPLPRRESQYGR